MRTLIFILSLIAGLWSTNVSAQCITEITCSPPILDCSTPEATFGCAVTGNGPFIFSWQDSQGNTISADSLITVNLAGEYLLQITDTEGCTEETTIMVDADLTVPTCELVLIDNDPCFNAPSMIVAECNVGIFTYAWEFNGITISTTPEVAITEAGVYCVSITSTDGCISQECVVIPDISPSMQLEIIVAEQPSCPMDNDGQLIAVVSGGTPPYTYQWSNGANTSEILGLPAGTYSLTVSDQNGCTVTQSVDLQAVLQLDLGSDQTVYCEDNFDIVPPNPYHPAIWFSNDAAQVEITDSEGNAINFEGIAGYVTASTSEPDEVQNPDALHLYPATVIANNGDDICIPVTVDNFEDVVGMAFTINYDASLLSFDQVTNYNSDIPEFGPGNISNFQPGIINTNYFENNLIPTDLSNGATLFEICFSVIDATQDFTFEWSDPSDFTDNTLSTTVEESGTYTLRITDNNETDCWVEDEIEITFSDNLVIDLGADTLIYCEDDPFILSAFTQGGTGNYEYLWSTNETTPSIEITPSPDDIYYLTVTDGNGCVGIDSVFLTPLDGFVINIITTDVTCFGGFDGCVSVEVSGGTPPYAYTWDFGATGSNVCNLTTGTYNVTIVDANGCSDEASITIGEPDQLFLSVTEVEAPTCETSNNGALDVFITGGTPPYNYLWSTGENTPSLSSLMPGIYTITVTDANGCMVVTQYNLLPAIFADAGPDMALNCLSVSVTLDGSGSSIGPEIGYEWATSDGQILAGANTLNPVVGEPGTYYLTVINGNEPNCFSYDEVNVINDFVSPTVSVIPISCDSSNILYSPDFPNASVSWTYPDGSTAMSENPLGTTQSGEHQIVITDFDSGCTFEEQIDVALAPTSCTTLKGRLVQDTIEDCTPLATEPGLGNWIIAIEGGGTTYYAVTQADGYYEQSVPAGTYEVYPLIPNPLWIGCQGFYSVTLTNPGDMETLDIPVQEQDVCPDLSVDFSMPLMRACWTRSLYINYCNNGSAPAEDAFIEVTLDEYFTFQSASLPVADQNGNTYTFEVGDLAINECGSLVVTFVVSCEVQVGQTLCAEAKIFPNDPCEQSDPLWSGASLEVSSTCEESTVTFSVQNVGAEDMDLPSACIVIEDGVMLFVIPDSLRLNAGETYDYEFPANGSTYRLEIEQVPFHPGLSTPLAVIEGCGENEFGGISTGFVNQFSLDDQNDFIDIECREVVASYDPNDKHGFPRGYGDENIIYPGVPMEYLVNFQNTGNDTAFLVVIRDTISEHLDITSVRPGAASHDYTWDIDGDNVLVFTFENILLPDSTTNLEGSQGFIEYKINQVAGLPLGTVIENSAAIYFDINDPIITNTTTHKLGKDFIEVVNLVLSPDLETLSVNIIPNPAQQEAQFTLKGQTSGRNTFELFNSQGQQVRQQLFDGSHFLFRRGLLSEGLYYFRISNSKGYQASGQLILSE